jgi:hypothetical protein
MVAITATPKTKPFWGLVQQVGPWKTTPLDRQKSSMKDHLTIGGGVPAGGRSHAGHGEWMSVITPYQIDASKPLPVESTLEKIVTTLVDMKRQTKMGRVKTGLTMGARIPRVEEKQSEPKVMEPVPMGMEGFYVPDLSEKKIPTFVPPKAENDQVKAFELAQADERKRVMEKRSRTWGEFGKQAVGTAAASTLGFIHADVGGAMAFGKRAYDYLAPDLNVPVPSKPSKRKGSFQLGPEEIKRAKQFGKIGAERLKQAREELRALPVSQPASFRYKKSFEPKLAPIKEVRSEREKARPMRPERRYGPLGAREAEEFYTTEYPSRAGTIRKSKAKAKKRDKRYKYSPLEKM